MALAYDSHLLYTIFLSQWVLSCFIVYRLLEEQAEKEETERVKHFKSDRRPVLQGQIKNLESLCADLRQKIEVDVKKGLEHVAQLEESLAMNTERLEDLKKQYHFYKSALVYGEGGMYMGLDDVWLEIGSGCFLVDLIPVNRKMPELAILMSGVQQYSEYTIAPQGEEPASGEDNGVTLKIRLEGVKLAGENLSIPKFTFDVVDIVLAVRASLVFRYDLAQSKWDSGKRDFNLEVLSFKGPYGLSKTIMSPLLSMLSPTLRRFMLNRLPPELGTLIRTFPSPFSMRGEFEVKGLDLVHLKAPFSQSSLIVSISGYSTSQLDMFLGLQKSMDRSKPLRCISDLLAYRRKYIKNERYIRNEKIWENIQILWEQASSVYSALYRNNNPSECEAFESSRSTGRSGSVDNSTPVRGYPDIKFSRVLYTGLQLLRKSITADFQLMVSEHRY